MSKPRIGMVINSIGLGGVPEVAYQLMRHLHGAEYDVRLFALKLDDKLDKSRQGRVERFRELGAGVEGANPKLGKVGAIAALADWLRTERIDLLHSHSYRPNVYARLAGMVWRQSGLRIVAHYHNDYCDKWLKDEAAFRLERNLASSTDAFIAVSQSVGEHVSSSLSIAPDRVEVLHNGIDPHKYRNGDGQAFRTAYAIDDSRPVIGVVGRICEQKGQDLIIKAVREMKPAGKLPLFLIIGEEEDTALCRRLKADLAMDNLENDVRFLGHVEDMPAAYAAMDMLVAPSRWEGFALMLLEAMAASVPVIASRIPPIVEAVGRRACAHLVPPNDPQRLAEAITELLGAPAQLSRMSKAGPARAEQFSWTYTGTRLSRIYDRVLDRQRIMADAS